MNPNQFNPQFNIEKNKLKASNRHFIRKSVRKLNLIKDRFNDYVNTVCSKRVDGMESNEVLKEVLVLLMSQIAMLSLCKREQILPSFRRLGFGSALTDRFVEAGDVLDTLDKFQERYMFFIDYESIHINYLDYLNAFLNLKLSEEFGVDLKNQFAKMSRQEKNSNMNGLFYEGFGKSFLTAKKIEAIAPNFRLPVFEDNISKTVKKYYSFHDKIYFGNIYGTLYDKNRTVYGNNFSETEFKIFFYNLMETLLRDKSVLNISIDSQVKYGEPGNDRHKVKWINSFLQTWRKS